MGEHAGLVTMVVAAALGLLIVAWRKGASAPGNATRRPRGSAGDAAQAVWDESANRALALQQQYWTASPEEKAGLLARGLEALSPAEKLRLLHLACLEELATDSGREALESASLHARDMPAGPNRALVEALVTELRSPSSPYRPRHVALWQGKAGASDAREPDVLGPFENASFTHLGALEVVRLDPDHQPTEHGFVALDDLKGVIMGSPAMFRLAKLFFDDGRPDEVVFLPMLYGASWSSSRKELKDGSLTLFVSSIRLAGDEQARSLGLGLQDFVISGKGRKLLGIGSIGEIEILLSTDDPRFEEKCRARGLDPDAVKKQAPKKA